MAECEYYFRSGARQGIKCILPAVKGTRWCTDHPTGVPLHIYKKHFITDSEYITRKEINDTLADSAKLRNEKTDIEIEIDELKAAIAARDEEIEVLASKINAYQDRIDIMEKIFALQLETYNNLMNMKK